MIEFALVQYLQAPVDLSGRADTELFSTPIKIGHATIATRNDARKWLRNELGSAIFANRIDGDKGHTAIVLRKISGAPETHLKGDDRTEAIIQADVWTHGQNANIRAHSTSEALRLALCYYRGTWGNAVKANVCGVTVARQSMQVDSPSDSGNYWSFRLSSDYQINYAMNKLEVA